MEKIGPKEIEESCKVILDALDLRYRAWRDSVVKEKRFNFESLEVMDKMHKNVKMYVISMLGLDHDMG